MMRGQLFNRPPEYLGQPALTLREECEPGGERGEFFVL